MELLHCGEYAHVKEFWISSYSKQYTYQVVMDCVCRSDKCQLPKKEFMRWYGILPDGEISKVVHQIKKENHALWRKRIELSKVRAHKPGLMVSDATRAMGADPSEKLEKLLERFRRIPGLYVGTIIIEGNDE